MPKNRNSTTATILGQNAFKIVQGIAKSRGDRFSPCLRPISQFKNSDFCRFTAIQDLVCLASFRKRLKHLFKLLFMLLVYCYPTNW